MTDIGPKRFRLLFRGELEPGTDPERARALFRERFRVDDDTLDRCFSGRKVALRSRLTEAEAFRLQADLQAEGLITRIEARPGGPPATPAQPQPETSAPEPTPAVPPAGGASCRECRAPINASALHCPFCGARQRDSGRGWATLPWLAALVLVLVPLVVLVVLPLLRENRTGERVEQAVRQGEQTAEKVRDFIQRTGFRPNSNLDAGLAEPPELARPPLASIRLSKGALITLRFQPDLPEIGGKTIVFLPRMGERNMPQWVCRAGTLEPDRLPSRCRAEGERQRSTSPPPPEPSSVEAGDGLSRRVIGEEIEAGRDILERMRRFQQRRGRWPQNNAELGLAAPEELGSSAARSVRVLPEGALEITFIATVANDHYRNTLTLYRDGDRWRCRSDMAASVLPEECQRDPDGSR